MQRDLWRKWKGCGRDVLENREPLRCFESMDFSFYYVFHSFGYKPFCKAETIIAIKHTHMQSTQEERGPWVRCVLMHFLLL